MQQRQERNAVWPTILVAGGLCWLIVTVAEVLWVLPMARTMTGGTYVVSSLARFVNHFFDFGLSALAYRAALAMGWPTQPRQRALVLAVHAAMMWAVMRFAMLSTTLSAAYIDGHSDMLVRDDGTSMLWDVNLMSWVGTARFTLPPYLLGLAVVALVLLARRFQRRTLELAQLSVDYANARIAMLSAQLQPHFLFNSLHAISELVEEQPGRAVQMIARLGDFLRYALDSSKQPWTSVSSEMEGLRAYIAVQRTRFGEELDITIDCAPEASQLTLPSLLMQPLVENAIEHGRRDAPSPLAVRVEARREGGLLRLSVSNSWPTLSAALAPSAFNDGLNNVAARLRAAYGDAARLDVGPAPVRGTLATLTLPALDRPPDGDVVLRIDNDGVRT